MNSIQNIDVSILQLIDSALAHQYHIMPVSLKESIPEILIDEEKSTEEIKNELNIILGKEIIFYEKSWSEISPLLNKYYRKQNLSNKQDLKYQEDFLLKIILEAKNVGSSDIHIETYEKKNRIRMRIDGRLIERYLIKASDYPIIVNKIKILAQLDISEKRLPQDGRINIKDGNNDFDIRVSVLPTLHGEKIVMRILSKDSSNVNLGDLGFSIKELKTYRGSIRKPNGILLISGPTGSGKTTTLYATLKELNKEHTNILTIEDPIEYTLDGINQVQLKESIGLNFSTALKTFLRQDPDIIMLGEIRDVETANMAIRAALTGHLVLSTIHTNSATATIDRLLDMGIPPFLIASTLNLSVAQRLVRKLCPACKQKQELNISELPSGFTMPHNIETHYTAVGCGECYYTGYAGRKAIYELIPMNEDLRHMIKNRKTDFENYIKTNNTATLASNAFEMVKNGETSIEEIYSLLN